MTETKRKFFPIVFLALVVLGSTAARGGDAPPTHSVALDTVVLGDAQSEQEHRVTFEQSDVIRGGLGEPARRLLPREPVSFLGGTVSFTLKVDPQRQNYVTVKLWGSDKGAGLGRLVLFADGMQVGYRHEGDYDVLNQADDEAECLGRFLYQTLPLPPALTHDKSSIDLKIISLGPQWPYGQTFAQYQKDLKEPTRGIYRVYTHTATRFVPDASERQGAFETLGVRPGPGEEVIAHSKRIVDGRLTKLLASSSAGALSSDPKGRFERMLLLSEAYNTPWSTAYHDARAIALIVSDGDAVAADAARDPHFVAEDWPGAGPMGEAVMRVWPAIQQRMGETAATGSMRGRAWANALRASVDYWRTHRRGYTNQSMIVDRNIYTANRALQLIDPSRALPESKALRYVEEAVGIEPWLGSDPVDASAREDSVEDAPGKGMPKPFGMHYYLVTRKGLTRELGWVGTYGETILHFTHDIAVLTGDARIREQLRKLESARMYFRYPGVDADGYRCMKLTSEIDNRTAHYPLSGAAYTAPDIREEWWMDVPALLADDPVSVGAARQSLSDHQYLAYFAGRLGDPDTLGMMRNVDDYAKVKALPSSGYRLPMTDGQPDFAFADEEDAVLALKHGDTRLFVNFYYRAERGVNGVARLLEVTPTVTRIATVRTDFQVISSGQTYTRPDWIDAIRSPGHPPPGEVPHQAWAGEKLPIAARPADAKLPKYGDWGPFVGMASFYRLQYGDYLIGMNCSERGTYRLDVPSDRQEAQDLVSGKAVALDRPVRVGPLSTVVLYLPERVGGR
jgi:hypothetical protein